jgi:hypothetical protein
MAEIFEDLMQAARAADWAAVSDLTEVIRNATLPGGAEELQEYARNLKEALVVVKASRADLAMSAARLNAAVGFQSSGPSGANSAEKRQNPGIVADF